MIFMKEDTTDVLLKMCTRVRDMFIRFNLYKTVTTYKWERNVIKDAEPMSHNIYYIRIYKYI